MFFKKEFYEILRVENSLVSPFSYVPFIISNAN